jgi:arylsulfatase A
MKSMKQNRQGDRSMKNKTNLIMAAILAPLAALTASGATKQKPNIVVIMADDLGYGDISCNGGVGIKTPNIDRLAAEGLRFTSGYASSSICTASRYSFLTGNYAFREPRSGIAPPLAPAIIRPGTETVASLLRRAGYATAVIGKWHLGLGDKAPDWNGELKPGPLEIGFDYCFLLPATNDRVPPVYVENHRVRNLDPADPLWVGMTKPSEDFPTGVTHRDTLKIDWIYGHNNVIHNGIGRIGYFTGGTRALWRDEDLADEWVRQSVRWIEENRDRPFFLFYGAHEPHTPRVAHERFQGKSAMGSRGDVILQFDWCVGELLATLDRLGLAENTLVVLCSDNGPVLLDGYKDDSVEKLGDHKPAGPFSGGKYRVLEGGTRTPFITRWKDRIHPGVSDQMVSQVDLPASFAALTGQNLPDNAFLDSLNLLDALLGKPGAKGRGELLQQTGGGSDSIGNRLTSYGLRMGDWKLVKERSSPLNTPIMTYKEGLFDLSKDPGEKTNLAAQYPEQMKRLQDRLEAILASKETRLSR